MESTLKKRISTRCQKKSELFITILASVARGIRKHLKQQPMGDTETLSGWNLYHIDASVWLWKRRGWKFSHHRIEAETVRWIYESYLNGMGVYVIAKALNQKGIPTIRGAEKWRDGVIQDILKNPIYEGDMLQQRTYTETRFPFVRRVNNGQRNQYLIKDSHPPIVTHEGGRSGTQPDGIPGGCTAHEQE